MVDASIITHQSKHKKAPKWNIAAIHTLPTGQVQGLG